MAHKILFLDDDEVLLNLMKDYFSARHFEVDVARRISEAKDLLPNATYSVAILDLGLSQLDHTDGLDMVKYIRKQSPRTRIIVYTGNDNPEVRRLAIRLGAELFLVKPVSLSNLEEMVSKLCC